MTISANTIFHFTKDYTTLLNILKTKFYPRLCLENNFFAKKDVGRIAVPMVCFCDIPLSQISDHIDTYGGYAIGLKKSWAIDKGITPVLYTHKESLVTKTIGANISSINKQLEKDDALEDFLRKRQNGFIYTSFFMKPYKGEQEVGGRIKKITFYNEREWRYIPPMIDDDLPKYLIESDFEIVDKRNTVNSSLERFGLEFQPSDIRYLIVEREDEILDLQRRIKEIKDNAPGRELELLATRIISIERIKEDF